MSRKRFVAITLLSVLLLLLVIVMARGPLLRLAGVSLPSGSAQAFSPTLPPGFRSNLFAEGLDAPRLMAVGPDGTLFVAERGRDRIVALPDRDGDGRADETVVVAEGLDSPTSLAFQPGTGALYVGETSRVSRLQVDGLRATARDTVVSDLPERGGHNTTTVLFGTDGRLYVSRGSTCNVCEESNPRQAAVWVYEADGSEGQLFMTGLRNAVGLALNPATGEIWASNNGRDLLGNEVPPETVYRLEAGADAGWPRCHAGTLIDPDFGRADACEGVAMPVVTMQAHSAPLGLTFYEGDALPCGISGGPVYSLPRLVEPRAPDGLQGGARAARSGARERPRRGLCHGLAFAKRREPGAAGGGDGGRGRGALCLG